MKRLCAVTLAIFLSSSPVAAADMPDWVALDDIQRASAMFPEHPVAQLLNFEELRVAPSGDRTIKIRAVYHDRQGVAGEYDHLICSESPMRKIKEFRGWRRDADGSVESFDKAITTQLYGGELYADEKEVSIHVSGAGPGALIAFELVYVDKLPAFGTAWWRARGDAPTLVSEYGLSLPGNQHARAYWFDPGTEKLTPAEPSLESDMLVWRRTALGVPVEEEPFSPPDFLTSPVLLVRYESEDAAAAANWHAVAEWAGAHFQTAFEGKEGLRDVAGKLARGSSDFDTRVRRVADFVRSSIGYVQIYLGDGGFRPHPAVDVYRNRFGDCKDMSHLVIALLSFSGIRSYPVLTSVGHSDPVFPGFPMNSFNHCIVAVEPPDPQGGWIFLDPTAKPVSYGRFPFALEGAFALPVGAPSDTALIRLPESGPEKNLDRIRGEIELKPGLLAIAHISHLKTGQSAFAMRAEFRGLSPEKRAEQFRRWLSARFVAARLERVEFTGLDESSDSLSILYDVRIPEAGRTVGDLVMVQPDFITAHATRLFPSKTRMRDIVFDYPARFETEISLAFPDEWTAKETPADASIENRFGTYSRHYELGAGRVTVTRTEQILQKHLRADEYALAQEWDRACYDADRTRLVLQLP